MSEKNILFLSYDGMTDPLGQSQVLPYLTGLSKRGYGITLVSFEKEDRFEKGKTTIEQICLNSGIRWYPQQYTKKPPVLSTIKDVRTMRKIAARLHRERPFHLVHCRSYIAALAGQWMKKHFGIPFIFDMRGFWADERVDGGLWKLSNPVFKRVYRFFKRKEKQFLTEAAAIISLTHNAKEELASWRALKQPLPITVIPCCVDLDLFNPDKIEPSVIKAKRTALNIGPEQFVLTYIGSIGTWYLLDDMLLFFKALATEKENAVFLFVTTEPAAMVFEAAARLGIQKENIRVTAATRKEVPVYIMAGDFSLFFIKQAYSKKASSPTKQGEIMAMGKPVICNTDVGDTDYVVNQFQSGILVPGFEATTLKQAVLDLSERQFDENAIRNGAASFFSLEKGIASYARVYENVLHAKR